MRGVITNRKLRQQIVDYSGLRYDTITPTDVDGLIEYQNLGFVLLEFKQAPDTMPTGQKLAYERLVDAIDKPAICILAINDTPIDQDIPAHDLVVDRVYWKGKWRSQETPVSVKNIVDRFLDYCRT